MVAQQRLGFEADGGEHVDVALLVGDDLDGQLAEPHADALDQAVSRECRPEALPPVRGTDDQAELADVGAPPDAGDDRQVGGRVALLIAHQPSGRCVVGAPPGDRLGVGRLLEEGAVALGHVGEERGDAVDVRGDDASGGQLRGGVLSHAVSSGIVVLTA